MEAEAELRRKLIEQEKEKKLRIKMALEEQIYNKQVLGKYAKEIEKEAEKAKQVY